MYASARLRVLRARLRQVAQLATIPAAGLVHTVPPALQNETEWGLGTGDSFASYAPFLLQLQHATLNGFAVFLMGLSFARSPRKRCFLPASALGLPALVLTRTRIPIQVPYMCQLHIYLHLGILQFVDKLVSLKHHCLLFRGSLVRLSCQMFKVLRQLL